MSGNPIDDAIAARRNAAERRYMERFGLCPDHRDKPTGVCPLCTIETRTRQRDALLEALRACEISMSYLDEHTHFTIGAHNALAGAREAIARATTDTAEKP